MPAITTLVLVPNETSGETPELPSRTIPAGFPAALWTVRTATVYVPLCVPPKVALPRIVSVAPSTVSVPLVQSRTVESLPSPIVVSDVIVM